MSVVVLLVDDHPLVLDALRRAIADEAGFEVHTAESLRDGRESLHRLQPTVLVTDVRLPDGSGLKLIEEAQTMSSVTACLVLSSFDGAQYVATARRLGAAGYLLKTESATNITTAIKKLAGGATVFPGHEWDDVLVLSERERSVVTGVVAGWTNDEIAARLGISRKGVEAHLSRIYARADVASRTELAIRAEREGWLDAY